MSVPPSPVILITGCSSGFGLLTAARLSSLGYSVYATMRDVKKANDLLTEVRRRNGQVKVLSLDVTDPDTIKSAVESVLREQGRIDVLVNNAGYGIGGFFEDLTEQEIVAQLDVNFFGVQRVSREVIPAMRRQRSGKIINISSVAGLYALPAFSAYNASKWALEGFSESLYYELKLFGINVCLIEPGTYKTKIFYENRRYAQRYSDPQSPYFKFSNYFRDQVDKYVDSDKKNPEDIAILVEKLIRANNPPFRNIPDLRSRILFMSRRFLPFFLFSGILYRGIFARMK